MTPSNQTWTVRNVILYFNFCISLSESTSSQSSLGNPAIISFCSFKILTDKIPPFNWLHLRGSQSSFSSRCGTVCAAFATLSTPNLLHRAWNNQWSGKEGLGLLKGRKDFGRGGGREAAAVLNQHELGREGCQQRFAVGKQRESRENWIMGFYLGVLLPKFMQAHKTQPAAGRGCSVF